MRVKTAAADKNYMTEKTSKPKVHATSENDVAGTDGTVTPEAQDSYHIPDVPNTAAEDDQPKEELRPVTKNERREQTY
jgi:hypothetical protein